MFSLLLTDLNFLFLSVITAAGVVSCGGRKKSPALILSTDLNSLLVKRQIDNPSPGAVTGGH